jgi:hypothetical protein
VRLIDDLSRDVRLALRQFRMHPTFALITVLVLGLGTGAATAVFTIDWSLSGTAIRARDSHTIRFHRSRSWSFARFRSFGMRRAGGGRA